MPGHVELFIIAGIALLFFGNRLPSVAKNIGRSFSELRKGAEEARECIEESLDDEK